MSKPSIYPNSAPNSDNWQGAVNGYHPAPQYPSPEPVPIVQHSEPQRPSAASNYPWPPGLAGDIARYIYDTAPRPVSEVAVVGALALLAGICGKAWNTPGTPTGLNLYLILVARSGVGKEAMHQGANRLMKVVGQQTQYAANFINSQTFASGTALQKALPANPSFVNFASEFGQRLAQMAKAKPDSPADSLKNVLLQIYSKSGKGDEFGGVTYSDNDKSTRTVTGVAFSLAGETTPSTFESLITDSMMENGFMSRFTVIEYQGERPEENEQASLFANPPQELVSSLATLVVQSQNLIAKQEVQGVQVDQAAATMLKAFNLECDKQINSTDVESRRQMWNRAYLKALKIACLLATGVAPYMPTIRPTEAQWAIDLVKRDIQIFSARLEGGDIGDSDLDREKKIEAVLKSWIEAQPKEDRYLKYLNLWQAGIAPRSFIQARCQTRAFKDHPSGANKALQATLDSLERNGRIRKIPRIDMSKDYDCDIDAYRILDFEGHVRVPLPNFWNP